MDITSYIVIGVLFLITWVVISISNTPLPEIDCQFKSVKPYCHYDCYHSNCHNCSFLSQQNYSLMKENDRLRRRDYELSPSKLMEMARCRDNDFDAIRKIIELDKKTRSVKVTVDGKTYEPVKESKSL